MAPAFAPPAMSVNFSAVPRLRMCDHVAPGCTMSSNKIFFLSFPMEFFRQDDGFREVAHRPPQPAAFASQVEIRLFSGDTVAMLQYPLRTLDHFAVFERAFHFERF